MNHLITSPILLPAFTAVLLLFIARRSLVLSRVVSLVSAVGLLAFATLLLSQAAADEITVYALGNWVPPFGIVLVADRLSALLVFVNSLLVLGALIYTLQWNDEKGDNLQPLIHFLAMGVNGAFLTGDLFNLFVFFEIMLIASYALMLHGGGRERSRAGLHYVILNLVGSSLFIVGVGVVYGMLGSMNMADLANKMSQQDPANGPILAAAGLILLIVFGLKSAMLPLYFWLPRAYSAAAAPVAALFAIMTKVGIYSIVRVHGMIFDTGPVADLITPWMWPLALATIAVGSIGVLAAKQLRVQLAYSVIVSVGTMLAAIAIDNQASMQALFYYLLHSTWITGALFLLADVIAKQRGKRLLDKIVRGPRMRQNTLLGTVFFIAVIALIGMPPLSGFFGKVLLLQATPAGIGQVWLWTVLLVGSFATIVAFGRTGSTLFWRVDSSDEAMERAPTSVSAWFAIGLLMLTSVVLVVFAQPILVYLDALALQLMNPSSYIDAVLSLEAVQK